MDNSKNVNSLKEDREIVKQCAEADNAVGWDDLEGYAIAINLLQVFRERILNHPNQEKLSLDTGLIFSPITEELEAFFKRVKDAIDSYNAKSMEAKDVIAVTNEVILDIVFQRNSTIESNDEGIIQDYKNGLRS